MHRCVKGKLNTHTRTPNNLNLTLKHVLPSHVMIYTTGTLYCVDMSPLRVTLGPLTLSQRSPGGTCLNIEPCRSRTWRSLWEKLVLSLCPSGDGLSGFRHNKVPPPPVCAQTHFLLQLHLLLLHISNQQFPPHAPQHVPPAPVNKSH